MLPWWLALPAGEGEVQVKAPVQSGSLAERTDAFEREQILAEVERSHLYKKCQALGIGLRAMRSGGLNVRRVSRSLFVRYSVGNDSLRRE